MSTTKYMHMWHGHPAWYDAKDRVIYVASPRRVVRSLATSLKQIKREQAADRQKVRESGRVPEPAMYGYVRVRV